MPSGRTANRSGSVPGSRRHTSTWVTRCTRWAAGVTAAEALRTALRIEPNNPLALINLGTVLSESRDPASLEEAEAVCRRAVALAPQLPQAVSNLEKVLRLKGRLVESSRRIRRRRISSRAWRT